VDNFFFVLSPLLILPFFLSPSFPQGEKEGERERVGGEQSDLAQN